MTALEANFECVMTRPAGVEAARSNLIESCAGFCFKNTIIKRLVRDQSGLSEGSGGRKGVGGSKPKAIVHRSVKRGLIKKNQKKTSGVTCRKKMVASCFMHAPLQCDCSLFKTRQTCLLCRWRRWWGGRENTQAQCSEWAR